MCNNIIRFSSFNPELELECVWLLIEKDKPRFAVRFSFYRQWYFVCKDGVYLENYGIVYQRPISDEDKNIDNIISAIKESILKDNRAPKNHLRKFRCLRLTYKNISIVLSRYCYSTNAELSDITKKLIELKHLIQLEREENNVYTN